MRQFVYISTAAPGIGEDDVAQILASSQTNNPRRGITGFLLFNGRNFLQLVEGEESSLLSLMNTLARDRRHAGIVRLEDSAIEEPNCGEWSMQRIDLRDDVAKRQSALQRVLPGCLSPDVRRTVLNFAKFN